MPCPCVPADYTRCSDGACPNSRATKADHISDDDDDLWSECAHCQARTEIDDLRHHGDGFDLCPKCSAAFEDSVMRCHHFYDPEPVWDDHGDEGRVCRHCACFVDRALAMLWAPLICDGFVDIEEPSP